MIPGPSRPWGGFEHHECDGSFFFFWFFFQASVGTIRFVSETGFERLEAIYASCRPSLSQPMPRPLSATLSRVLDNRGCFIPRVEAPHGCVQRPRLISWYGLATWVATLSRTHTRTGARTHKVSLGSRDEQGRKQTEKGREQWRMAISASPRTRLST